MNLDFVLALVGLFENKWFEFFERFSFLFQNYQRRQLFFLARCLYDEGRFGILEFAKFKGQFGDRFLCLSVKPPSASGQIISIQIEYWFILVKPFRCDSPACRNMSVSFRSCKRRRSCRLRNDKKHNPRAYTINQERRWLFLQPFPVWCNITNWHVLRPTWCSVGVGNVFEFHWWGSSYKIKLFLNFCFFDLETLFSDSVLTCFQFFFEFSCVFFSFKFSFSKISAFSALFFALLLSFSLWRTCQPVETFVLRQKFQSNRSPDVSDYAFNYIFNFAVLPNTFYSVNI